MGSVILKAAMAYLEKNPAVVEELIGALVQWAIQAAKDNAKAAA